MPWRISFSFFYQTVRELGNGTSTKCVFLYFPWNNVTSQFEQSCYEWGRPKHVLSMTQHHLDARCGRGSCQACSYCARSTFCNPELLRWRQTPARGSAAGTRLQTNSDATPKHSRVSLAAPMRREQVVWGAKEGELNGREWVIGEM